MKRSLEERGYRWRKSAGPGRERLEDNLGRVVARRNAGSQSYDEAGALVDLDALPSLVPGQDDEDDD